MGRSRCECKQKEKGPNLVYHDLHATRGGGELERRAAVACAQGHVKNDTLNSNSENLFTAKGSYSNSTGLGQGESLVPPFAHGSVFFWARVKA